MVAPDTFKDLLWRELETAQLIPDEPRYQRNRADVTHWGYAQHGDVVELAGKALWRRVISQLEPGYSDAQCIRVLGFGHALTEFAVAPLRLPATTHAVVVRLGALANFIVATYDHLVDQGERHQRVLPAWQLRLALHSQGRSMLRLLGPVSPATSRMMARLVVGYCRQLGELPYARQHKHALRGVRTSILRMYAAERATLLSRPDVPSTRTLRQKAALPFVVMGLPAWLGTPHLCQHQYWWHMRWLYRLGLFFGWIDDAVDLEADRESHRPNLIAHSLRDAEPGDGKDVALARLIARRGACILEEWKHQIQNIHELPDAAAGAFSTCLVSWFGGLPRPA